MYFKVIFSEIFNFHGKQFSFYRGNDVIMMIFDWTEKFIKHDKCRSYDHFAGKELEAKRKFGKFGEYGIFILLVFFSLTLFFYFFRNRNKGTYRCNSRHGCPTCPYIENGRRFCKFEQTGEIWNIEKCITCKSTNLINL